MQLFFLFILNTHINTYNVHLKCIRMQNAIEEILRDWRISIRPQTMHFNTQ